MCNGQEQIIIILFCEIQVNIEIPFAFRAIPVQAIESAGTQVLEQILKLMLPRFIAQVFLKYFCIFCLYSKVRLFLRLRIFICALFVIFINYENYEKKSTIYMIFISEFYSLLFMCPEEITTF